MKTEPGVSLILPVYQAESFICRNLHRVARYCAETPCVHEVILVNDGSRDRTHEIILDFLAAHPDSGRFRYIALAQNAGKGAAVKAGVDAAGCAFLVFTDCDLPYDFDDITHIARCLIEKQAHVVVGSRMHPDSVYLIRSPNLSYIYIRHTLGRLFNRMTNLFTGLNMADTQAGLKGLDRETARLCFEKLTIRGFAFDIDLLVCARANRRKIATVPLRFYYESEMTTVSFLKHAVFMTGSLLCIAVKKARGAYL